MKTAIKFYRLLAFKLRRAIRITAFKAQFKSRSVAAAQG